MHLIFKENGQSGLLVPKCLFWEIGNGRVFPFLFLPEQELLLIEVIGDIVFKLLQWGLQRVRVIIGGRLNGLLKLLKDLVFLLLEFILLLLSFPLRPFLFLFWESVSTFETNSENCFSFRVIASWVEQKIGQREENRGYYILDIFDIYGMDWIKGSFYNNFLETIEFGFNYKAHCLSLWSIISIKEHYW